MTTSIGYVNTTETPDKIHTTEYLKEIILSLIKKSEKTSHVSCIAMDNT